jgi:phage-related minor tail protein
MFEQSHKNYVENMRDQGKDLKTEIEKGLDPGTLKDAIDELTNKSVPKFEFTMIDSLTAIEGATATLQDAFTSLFTGGIHNAREFFQTILRGLANVFAQMAANQLVSNIMGAFKGALQTQSIADVMAQGPVHARGAVFNAGAPVPFMQGGVIGGPTVFPMASGAVGLMGEAGPEAIMPLKRMGDGKLGVAAGLPNIQIVNNTGVQANASAQMKGDRMSIVLEAAQLGASMAEQRFNRSLRTGYGPAAKSMQTVYNLRRNV